MPFAIAPAFAPATAALGGAVFGLATTAQLVLNGRLTGFSTIIAATFGADTLQTSGKTRESRVDEAAWKSALVAGLVLGGWWMREALPRVFLYGDAAAAAAIDASRSFFPPPTMTSLVTAIFAGLLVGFGSRLGKGCTSGHGVCGLSRFSARSLVAVLSFFASGLLTATLRGAWAPHFTVTQAGAADSLTPAMSALYARVLAQRHWLPLALAAPLLLRAFAWPSTASAVSRLSSLAVGFVLAFALGLGGMLAPPRVIAMLDLSGATWDPSLMAFMAAALAVNVPLWRVILRRERPLLHGDFDIPTQCSLRDVDIELVAGSLLFGVGWGLAGMCPGPAAVALGAAEGTVLVFSVALAAGMLLAQVVMQARKQKYL